MYGRGRGNYLGLLLESQIGKTALGSSNSSTGDKTSNDNVDVSLSKESLSSPKQSAPLLTNSSHSQDNGRKSPQPTWTPLDLLGNRGKRSRRGSDSSPKTVHENSQVSEDNKTRDLKDNTEPTLPSTHFDPKVIPDQKPKILSSDPVKKIHLISPQEFLLKPQGNSSVRDEVQADISEIDSSSDASESNTSSSSRYIPPHLRKGFSGRPDTFTDPAITRYKQVDMPQYSSSDEITVPSNTQTLGESELNWQKWKLQRSFKKLLNNLSDENVVGLNVGIRNICETSKLSTKFHGASEVNVLVDLLVARVIEEKENFEVAVQLCRLLNVMYKDELPANLKDVLRQYRKETFNGLARKNSSCENFCIFLGKLCDVAKDETKSFQDCLRQSVVGCLHDWITLFQMADECSQEAELKVIYLCSLLVVTRNVLTTEKRSWIKSCYGKIKNCILCEKLPRSVRENLLDHIIKCSLQPQTTKTTAESLASTKTVSDTNLSDDLDAYKNVKKMLSDLELTHLLEKFQDNLIRDTLLCAEKNELKSTLQEASFAPGAILEIQLYLEKNEDIFNGNVPEKTAEAETSRDVDTQTQVKVFENSLKQILSEISSEKQKQAEKQNEAEPTKQNDEQNESNSGVENVKPLDTVEHIVEELKNQTPIPTFASVCRPPPGFSYPGHENRSTTSSSHVEEVEANSNESFLDNDFPDLMSKREVSLGEKKNNIMEFKDENTQAGNPVVNWTQNGGSFKRNERSLPKYKGRGRGRRDTSGTLEDAKKDNTEYQVFSEDTRGSRWNLGDIKGFQHGSARDKNGSGESSQWKSHSPLMSREGKSRPLGIRRDMKGFSWNDEGQLGYSGEINGSTSRETFPTDTTENTYYGQETRAELGLYSSADAGFGTSRVPFGSSVPVGCFICGAKDHRSAYCTNNAAMFD